MGATGPVYRTDEAGRLNWYVADGLGSTVAEVDGQGGVIVARQYDVYGQARAYWMRGQQGRTPPDETSKHRFVGALVHTSEGETGLIYMRARYMDSETGRFVREDPTMDGGNWFVYCDNDPANQADQVPVVPIPTLHRARNIEARETAEASWFLIKQVPVTKPFVLPLLSDPF